MMRRILAALAVGVLVTFSPLVPVTPADAAAGTACTTGYSNKLTIRRVVAQCPIFQSRGPWRTYGLSETTCSFFPVRRVWIEYR